MKKFLKVIIGFVITLSVSQIVFTTDFSIFLGKWKMKTKKISIDLNIKKSEILLKIDGKKIKDIKYEYVYPKSSGKQPFLFIESEFQDIKYTEHTLYLVIGTKGDIDKKDYDYLRGFYELSELVDEKTEEGKYIYFPIDLEKIGQD